MIQQKLRKVGNSYVVTIPKSEVERQGWHEGQLLSVEVQALEVMPLMDADLARVFEETWERNQEAYRYLADR